MKKISGYRNTILLLLAGSSLFFSCNNNAARYQLPVQKYLSEDSQYQQDLKAFYLDTNATPLFPDERQAFQGIRFFPIDSNYITLAQIIPVQNGDTIAMPTSSGKTKYFKEYGNVSFTLKGVQQGLTIYQSVPLVPGSENSLFLPYRDATNGKTTYGNGRYLDIELVDIKNNQVVIDFNRAYNPYCAYSKHYNCPVTPYKNMVTIPVTAGVSLVGQHH